MLLKTLFRKRGAVALAAALALTVAAPAAKAADLLVLAAASLKNALEETAQQYERETGTKVTLSFAASSALAKQIEQGAPADLFFSADLDWMDYLAKRTLIQADTRTNLLSNRLVIVAPAARAASLDAKPGFPLAQALGEGRLATGDPAHVPVGKYAKTALEKLGVWAQVEPKLARTDNVRAALALVSRGEAPLGIVYETDAKADKGVKVVGMFPANSHDPIIYPVAVTASSTKPQAKAFLAYLSSGNVAAIFERHGFSRPGTATN